MARDTKVWRAVVGRTVDIWQARDLFVDVGTMLGFAWRRGKDQPMDLRWRGQRFVARPSDWVAVREILLHGEYDDVCYVLGPHTARVLDLGANIGCFSMLAWSLAPAARVHSVEPALDTFALLELNRRRSDHSEKWSTSRAAVWSSNGTAQLQRSTSSTGHGIGKQPGKVTEEVPTVTLREMIMQVGGSVDVLKMDIEGAEGAVLLSDPDVLRLVSHLLVEIHPAHSDVAALFQVLRRNFANLYDTSHRSTSDKPVLLCTSSVLPLPVAVKECGLA